MFTGNITHVHYSLHVYNYRLLSYFSYKKLCTGKYHICWLYWQQTHDTFQYTIYYHCIALILQVPTYVILNYIYAHIAHALLFCIKWLVSRLLLHDENKLQTTLHITSLQNSLSVSAWKAMGIMYSIYSVSHRGGHQLVHTSHEYWTVGVRCTSLYSMLPCRRISVTLGGAAGLSCFRNLPVD